MEIFAISNTGLRRNENQDAFLHEKFNDKQFICVICDGMGGIKGGKIASKLATESFLSFIKTKIKPDMSYLYMENILSMAVKNTNKMIYDKAVEISLEGMGTTLTAVIADTNKAVIANIGDSRAYHISKNKITQVTNDHSLVWEMVKSGKITEEEATTYPGKNLITRALGPETEVEGDYYQVEILSKDAILLCSDGLTNLVNKNEILDIYKSVEPINCCEKLIELANSRGGYDNITVAVILF